MHSDSTRLDSIRLVLLVASAVDQWQGRSLVRLLARSLARSLQLASPGSSRSLAGVRCTAPSVTTRRLVRIVCPRVLSFARAQLTPIIPRTSVCASWTGNGAGLKGRVCGRAPNTSIFADHRCRCSQAERHTVCLSTERKGEKERERDGKRGKRDREREYAKRTEESA